MFVEPVKRVVHKAFVDDGRADGDEFIGQGFLPTAVVADRHAALVEAIELLLEVDGASVSIVAVDVPKGMPNGIGTGVGAAHYHRQQLGGDGAIQPLAHKGVEAQPLSGRRLGRSGVDVVLEGVLDVGDLE